MKKCIEFITNEKNHKFVIPAIAIFLGFFVGSIILILTGQNPIKLFTSIIKGVLGIDISRIGSEKVSLMPGMLESILYLLCRLY